MRVGEKEGGLQDSWPAGRVRRGQFGRFPGADSAREVCDVREATAPQHAGSDRGAVAGRAMHYQSPAARYLFEVFVKMVQGHMKAAFDALFVPLTRSANIEHRGWIRRSELLGKPGGVNSVGSPDEIRT